MGYQFNTTPERSKLMKKIKGKNTLPEEMLAKALWKKGIRYRRNFTKLPGKPDIVITKYKIVAFVDGEFWHGYNWVVKKDKIQANRDYWIKKIERNMERDKSNNQLLINMGYRVLRFWENEIKRDIEGCFIKVESAIKEQSIIKKEE